MERKDGIVDDSVIAHKVLTDALRPNLSQGPLIDSAWPGEPALTSSSLALKLNLSPLPECV